MELIVSSFAATFLLLVAELVQYVRRQAFHPSAYRYRGVDAPCPPQPQTFALASIDTKAEDLRKAA